MSWGRADRQFRRLSMRIAQPFMAGICRRMNPKVPSGTTENKLIQFLPDASQIFDKRIIGRGSWIEINPVRRIFTRCCGVLITRFLSSPPGLFRFVRLNPAMNGWAIFGEIERNFYRSAGFQTCRIADFQIGKSYDVVRPAGLKTCDTGAFHEPGRAGQPGRMAAHPSLKHPKHPCNGARGLPRLASGPEGFRHWRGIGILRRGYR